MYAYAYAWLSKFFEVSRVFYAGAVTSYEDAGTHSLVKYLAVPSLFFSRQV